MVLVDTSVLINYFKGKTDPKTSLFDEILAKKIPFGISPYTYQEILQVAKNKSEYKKLKSYLSTQHIYFLSDNLEVYDEVAKLFLKLRKSGITIRSSIDILIELTAIHYNLLLLHSDKDFDLMARELKELHILSEL